MDWPSLLLLVASVPSGRLLGMATTTPAVVDVLKDLLTPDAGFAISERVGEAPARPRVIIRLTGTATARHMSSSSCRSRHEDAGRVDL